MNPKIRFQGSQFKNRLQTARDFKRPARVNSKPDFLNKLHFFVKNNLLKSFIILILFCLVSFVLYYPKWFFISKIEVKNATSETEEKIKKVIENIFEKNLIWPQKNLILLSKKRLTKTLLEQAKEVVRVEKIEKKYPQTLTIQVYERKPKIFLLAKNKFYIVSNDGKILHDFSPNPSSSPPSLFKLKLNSLQNDLVVGQSIFSESKVQEILSIAESLSEKMQQKINFVEISNFNSTELKIQFQNGFTILFESKHPLSQILEKLNLLNSEIPSLDKKKLKYIDLTLPNKAFLCYKSTPCAIEHELTPSSTNINFDIFNIQ